VVVRHVDAAVANQFVHGTRKLVGIDGIRRIDPIAVFRLNAGIIA